MNKQLLSFAATTLAVAFAPLAGADLITWGPVQNVTGPNDVSTNGVSVVAFNCWASTFAAPTVNGVSFDAFAPNGWTNGGWSLNAGSSTGDVEYDSLLDSARATSGGSASNPTGYGAIQLDSNALLTVGGNYEIQVWYSDQRPGTSTNVLYDRVMNLSSATGPAITNGGIVTNLASLTQGPVSAGLDADPNNLAGAGDTIVGSYCIGTFTRTSMDELWLLIEGTHPIATNVLRPHINAFQIREIQNVGPGTRYCTAVANSTGITAQMAASGSASVAQNNLVIEASRMPLNSFGFFLTSATQGLIANPGGSQGNLCLGGSIGRYVGPGQIQNSGATGAISLAVDLTQHPTPTGLVSVQVGQTWNFTAWYRDVVGGSATSNFTDGYQILFQ
ncbi:MAG: hypothetical protein R3F49_14235 [Planctomycetota bacterium]